MMDLRIGASDASQNAACQLLKQNSRPITVGALYKEAEARYLSRSGLWAEGPIPLSRANWMRLVGYASGLEAVEAIATCFASGRSTLGAVNKPTQLGFVVRSSTTARPAERHLILLAQAGFAENLSGSRVPGLPFR